MCLTAPHSRVPAAALAPAAPALSLQPEAKEPRGLQGGLATLGAPSQPHRPQRVDLPPPARSHPDSRSPPQSRHSPGLSKPQVMFPFWTHMLPKRGSPHLRVIAFAQDKPLQDREVSPLLVGWLRGGGTGSGEGNVPRSGTRLCLLSPNLLGSGRFSSSPAPPQWGGAWSAPHAQPMQIWGGSWVWTRCFPRRWVNPGRLLEMGSPSATVCNAGGQSPAEGWSPGAWAGFAENVTLVRNCKT